MLAWTKTVLLVHYGRSFNMRPAAIINNLVIVLHVVIATVVPPTTSCLALLLYIAMNTYMKHSHHTVNRYRGGTTRQPALAESIWKRSESPARNEGQMDGF